MSLVKHFSVALWVGMVLALGGLPSSVLAQNELELQVPPSVLECLQTPAAEAGGPVYPADELTLKVQATVRVQLTFREPDSKPRVKIIENSAAPAFAQAVETFVEGYRLPCLVKDAAPVQVTQEFLFKPGDGRKVVFSAVEGEVRPKMDKACFQRPSGKPRYPTSAIDAGLGGNILAELTFYEMNAEPRVRILYNARSERLAEAVAQHAKAYRLVCPMPSEQPIKATQTFSFQLSDKDRDAFKDVDLMRFLRMVVPADLTAAKFNFNTMGCPFDMSVRVRRPYADNVVGEYGESDPRRKDLIHWVKKLRLQLPANLEPYLFDQEMKVSVPCASLDL